ncbi:hypothetical protein GF373_06340 [bacterium]|nr:hypothetical protein [bacterium]
MPVNLLLCEGGPGSPDVRVLSKILSSLCEVKPSGGKYGMGDRIISRRETLGADAVFGILDGDFIEKWTHPKKKPSPWTSKDEKISFGWRWERKEIENYLIDPDIVEKALSNASFDKRYYISALEKARDNISFYQAARIALNTSRKRFQPLSSSFGAKRGQENHPFPDELDESSCINGIKSVIQSHQQDQWVSEQEAIESYQQYKPECLQGGSRHKNYLIAFSGKDLLWEINHWLSQNNLIGAWAFREKIIQGIKNSTDDVSTWLAEWSALKDEIIKL